MKRWRYWLNGWVILSTLLALVVLVPLLFLVSQVLSGGGSLWQNLSAPPVRRYAWNTSLLLMGVGGGVLVLGVLPAWFVTVFDFPGRKWLSSGMVLPLVLPAYILAYTYAGMTDYTGPIETTLRSWFGKPERGSYLPFSIMNLYGLMFLLSVNLYPYVYMIARASFVRQSQGVLEVARNLGANAFQTFFRVVLPLARPAIVSGLTLCWLEVVNDYGAAEYFGVDTFATAIFREWFARDNVIMAIRLAALLMFVVGLLLLLERWQRGNARYDEAGKSHRPVLRQTLRGGKAWGVTLFCLFPLFFGFLLPMLQLVSWAVLNVQQVVQGESFVRLILNSLGLASAAALCTVAAALLLAYTLRLFPISWMERLSRLALIGYAVPGTVIAVGVMVVAAQYDRLIRALAPTSLDLSWLTVSGTFVLMLVAFVVRFLMVAHSPIDASFQRHGKHLNEASRLLGLSPLKTLWKVELPLIRNGLLAAGLLVFIDALKELPLTLFLRWGNFNTLSTEVYNLAKQMESVDESAVYAVMIALAGLVPVLVLNKLLGASANEGTQARE